MTGPILVTPLNPSRNKGTSSQDTTTQSIIDGHMSALKELLKEQSNCDLIKPMLLNFNDDTQDTDDEIIEINKGGQRKSNGDRRGLKQAIQESVGMSFHKMNHQVLVPWAQNDVRYKKKTWSPRVFYSYHSS
ncbi:hypothetical protein Tco_1190663 [Tanacetum coccineum]